MISKIIRTILGICLIPLSVAFIIGIVKILYKWDIAIREQFIFLLGFFSYIVVHVLFHKPIILHIFGHELTHAITSWIFGGKLKSLNVSEKGGSVSVDKTNFLITLAPYFIPIYTVFFLIIYAIVDKKYLIYIIFLIGFSLSFHIALTLHSIKEKQPDFKQYGIIFSLGFILFMNLLIIALFISVITGNIRIFVDICAGIPESIKQIIRFLM